MDSSKPSLIVFDLDFTLWDCGGLWIDCTSPPFCQDNDGRIRDSTGRDMRLYPDVPAIFEKIEPLGCEIAVASRTEQPGWARDLLELLEFRHRIHYEEIFPSSKLKHFTNLKQDSGIDFERMLFFDDEQRNISEVSTLGVKCVKVGRGVDLAIFDHGVSLFRSGTAREEKS